MREYVHEHRTVVLEPFGDATEDPPVVSHVLEHLHGDDAIEAGAGVEIRDVGGEHLDIGQSRGLGCGGDMASLARGVRYGRDAGAGVSPRCPESQRPPSAAEIQDALAVLEICPGPGQGQHGFFGARKVRDAVRPVGRGVFPGRAEDDVEE